MKHVSDFVSFDFAKWTEGKTFEIKAIYNNVDKNTGADLGGKNVLVTITEDKCPHYVLRSEYGETSFSLKYESFYVRAGVVNAAVGDKVKFSGMISNVSARSINGKQSGFLTVYFSCAEIEKIK